MTKLLDSYWWRSAQLFHEFYSCAINDFAMAEHNGGKPLKLRGNCPRGTLEAKGLKKHQILV